MCIYGRFIRNKYINKDFFVKCGHCPSCLQEKANKRMMRIYDEYTSSHLTFFVTLTYKRNACPYFNVDDYNKRLNPLPVFRDCRIKRTFGDSKLVNEKEHLTDVYVDYSSCLGNDVVMDFNFDKMKTLAHRRFQVGISYYPDLQNFIKRLKINLKRKYNYNGYFKTFCCSEYGENTLRPHFHLLIFGENSPATYSVFRAAVIESWPFCNKDRWSKGFQLADDATSYVSSYVNCPSDFPPFLKDNFNSKHSFSPHLGFNCKSFSLASLLNAVRSGNMQYLRETDPHGLQPPAILPIPKYVVNRYFPTFKGYSRFTSSQVYDVLRYPRLLSHYRQKFDYSDEDILKIIKQISNVHYKYFPDLSDSDYALLHIQAWTAYRSTCYKLFVQDDKIPILQKYDNLYELFNGSVHSDISSLAFSLENPIINPNQFSVNVATTNLHAQKFAEKIKRKNVSELITNQVYVT